MKKKATAFLFSLVILFSFHFGSAFAETPLNAVIDDLIGTPYKYAGTTTKGFDCSGFTMYVFEKFDIDLVHSSKEQNKTDGYWISKDDLRAGDLVFFNTGGGGISHVGIYVGDGEFVHSSSNHGVVKNKLSEKYYADRYVSARRILTDTKYKAMTTDPDDVADSAEADTGTKVEAASAAGEN